METQSETTILSLIAPWEPDDIDDIARAFGQRRGALGRDVFPDISAVLMPETRMKRSDAVCIGFAIAGKLPDACDRALRLAAFAVERDVEVIVFAHLDTCGFERYGFRCERVSGDTEAQRAACEDQLRRFWNIDLLL